MFIHCQGRSTFSSNHLHLQQQTLTSNSSSKSSSSGTFYSTSSSLASSYQWLEKASKISSVFFLSQKTPPSELHPKTTASPKPSCGTFKKWGGTVWGEKVQGVKNQRIMGTRWPGPPGMFPMIWTGKVRWNSNKKTRKERFFFVLGEVAVLGKASSKFVHKSS